MNNKLLLLSEMGNYTDKDAYISDMALSSMWGDTDGGDVPADRIEILRQLWEAAHRTYADIAEECGMSRRKLAERFAIPYRTAENWSTGVNEPPMYVLLMIQECVGLLDRKD